MQDQPGDGGAAGSVADGARVSRDRVPPGQYVTQKLPVLHLGPTPKLDRDAWDLRLFGLVKNPLTLTQAQIRALPASQVRADIHCVTRWSVLDTQWEGVRFRELAALVEPLPAANFVLVHAENDYTTNLPLSRLLEDDVLLAYHYHGQELSAVHGYPLRLVVPQLYFWKSAKWVWGIEFLEQDRPGFWETRGYHNDADPWQEQRYA